MSYYGNDVPFVKTPDMHTGVYVIASESMLSTEGADFQSNKHLPENTVLVACIGANAGEVAITAITSQTNQQINALVTDYPCYIYHFIKSNTDELRALGDGSSTMLNINKSSFENFAITVPPKPALLTLEREMARLLSLVKDNLFEVRGLESLQQLLVSRLSIV